MSHFKDKQTQLEPGRVKYAREQIEALGYQIINRADKYLTFNFNGAVVTVWPYTGWSSGKTINDCRGINNLLKQIKIAK